MPPSTDPTDSVPDILHLLHLGRRSYPPVFVIYFGNVEPAVCWVYSIGLPAKGYEPDHRDTNYLLKRHSSVDDGACYFDTYGDGVADVDTSVDAARLKRAPRGPNCVLRGLT
jgi:hypothetical protein